jgi:hypothetical protein
VIQKFTAPHDGNIQSSTCLPLKFNGGQADFRCPTGQNSHFCTTEAFTVLSLLLHSDDKAVFIPALSLIDDIHHENFVPDLSVHGHLDISLHEMKTRPLPSSLLRKMAELTQL